MGEVVEEWGVVQGEFVVHFVKVFEHFLHVAGPEFADQEQFVLAEAFLQVRDEFVGEAFREVLACVESEAFEFEVFHHPFTPVDHVADDLWV